MMSLSPAQSTASGGASGGIMYSLEVPHSAVTAEGWGPIHRSATSVPPVLAIPDAASSGQMIYTAYENFQAACRIHGPHNALGWRPIDPNTGDAGPYKWVTYAQMQAQVHAVAAGMKSLSLCPDSNDAELKGKGVLGLFSKNRPEWVIAEYAAHCHGVIPVPMYDTLDAEGVVYVVNQTSMQTLVCSLNTVAFVVQAKPQCPSLKHLVLMDSQGLPEDQRINAEALGLTVHTIDTIAQHGASLGERAPLHTPPAPSDIYTFCYTSGTTGEPKGALISHENLIACLAGVTALMLPISPQDVHLSYLPLPHMMERLIETYLLWGGAAIGFFQGDPLKIVEDLQALRPTLFPSVPRLLNRIKDKVTTQIATDGGLKEKLYNMAMNAKMRGLTEGHLTHALWDALLFSKIKAKVGLDRLRCMISGSAPLSKETMDWLRCVFGVPVQEGYGQTECTLVMTMQYPDDLSTTNVGAPIPCNELMLVDVPDMQYLNSDREHGGKARGQQRIPCRGRGEIWCRGPSIFQGYYKMPEKTAEAVDKATGWLKTGDIGLWTVDGKLKIIDRKKNIFKLAQGEYVAAEKIENVVLQSPFVMQAFVYGDSYKTSLVCIVVVDPDYLPAWAEKNGLGGKSLAELCSMSQLRAIILKDVHKYSADAKLMGFEVVKALHLEPDQWTPADLLTPTFKLKRKAAQERYQGHIDQLYAQLESTPGANDEATSKL